MDVLELPKEKPIICAGYTAILHMHTIAEEVQIKTLLMATLNNDKRQEQTIEKPKFVKGNCRITVRIESTKPLAIEKFDVVAKLGKFTLRDGEKTICLGRVTKYKPYKTDEKV